MSSAALVVEDDRGLREVVQRAGGGSTVTV
jgi:hypothetical protein